MPLTGDSSADEAFAPVKDGWLAYMDYANEQGLLGDITIEASVEEYIPLPVSIFGSGELFIVRASHDSMIEAGIDDGDLVVVRKQQTARDGDIVVALVNNENTLKRYYRDDKHHCIILHPENSTMSDIIVHGECYIQGVAQQVIKNL